VTESADLGVLEERRELADLPRSEGGQLMIEWVLVMAFGVMPFLMMIPIFLDMIVTYFYRTAEVIRLPFP
jgi:hypothetical protein